MSKLILLRHGQSEWNLSGRFQGHTDIELTEKGAKQALNAGELLKNIDIDQVFVSPLKRTWNTAILVVGTEYHNKHGFIAVPEFIERDYGDLAGMTHQEAEEKYEKDLVNQWRNSYDIPPPNGECLKDVAERTLPYFTNNIKPLLEEDKNVLIVSHRNPIRALVQFLDRLDNDEVDQIIVETASPAIYERKNNEMVRI